MVWYAWNPVWSTRWRPIIFQAGIISVILNPPILLSILFGKVLWWWYHGSVLFNSGLLSSNNVCLTLVHYNLYTAYIFECNKAKPSKISGALMILEICKLYCAISCKILFELFQFHVFLETADKDFSWWWLFRFPHLNFYVFLLWHFIHWIVLAHGFTHFTVNQFTSYNMTWHINYFSGHFLICIGYKSKSSRHSSVRIFHNNHIFHFSKFLKVISKITYSQVMRQSSNKDLPHFIIITGLVTIYIVLLFSIL